MQLAESRVYSLRISLTAIVQCYDFLEACGTPTANLKPTPAIRSTLEGLLTALAQTGKVGSYTDAQAAARFQELTKEDTVASFASSIAATLTPQKAPRPSQLAEEPGSSPTTSLPNEDEVLADPDVRAAARARIHARMQPEIEKARLEEEKKRFSFIGQNEGKAPRPPAEVEVSNTPPWLNAQVASTEEFNKVWESSDFCAAVVAQQNQLGALAAKMVLPNLSDDMLGGPVAEKLFHQTYKHLVNFVNDFPSVEIPQTFTDEETPAIVDETEALESMGVTAPPEINDEE
jgi:hypothetical protein